MHHDAITGTSRAVVVEDYMRRLADVAETARWVMTDMASMVLARNSAEWPEFTHASSPPLLAMSHELLTDLPIVLYNSLGWARNEAVQINMTAPAGTGVLYSTVVDDTGARIPAQLHGVHRQCTCPCGAYLRVSCISCI